MLAECSVKCEYNLRFLGEVFCSSCLFFLHRDEEIQRSFPPKLDKDIIFVFFKKYRLRHRGEEEGLV